MMLEPTNYLNNLNKRIEIASSEIGNVQLKESFVLNSQRNALDFSNIGAYLNDVIIASYSTLCSAPKYPKDAVANGLSGDTIVTWLETDGNNKYNEDVFWFKSENPDVEGRPCTIKESIQHIWANLNPMITQISSNPTDLGPLENSISCLDTMLERLKIDSFGNDFVLDCKTGWTKQKWPISKHVWEILNQLTVGHDGSDIAGLNKVSDYYPPLKWAIELGDLLDVDMTLPPEGGDSLIYNKETESWRPGKTDVKWINELYDVDTENPAPAGNDVLVWDPDHKDSNGSSQNGYSGAWVPVSPQQLFNDTTLDRINQLKDVDTTSTTPKDSDVLVWESDHVDNSDGGDTGAWVPKDLNDIITIPNGEQRLGNLVLKTSSGELVDSSSTLEDVSDFKDSLAQAFLQISQDPDSSALILAQFIQKANKKYRPGSLLHFNGFDKWYSNLGGNTSNLNALNYMPETFSKGSSYLANLTSTETAQKAYGGTTPVPFVFVNAFRLQYKELLDPTFRNVLILREFDQASEEITFDNGVLEAIIGDAYESSVPKLINEIELAEKTNSLAMTSTSTIYQVGNDLEIEYSPNYLLGVSRTDLSKEVNVELSASEKMFLIDENDPERLSGEINNASINDIQARVSTGIGNEVQHSGYTKIMCLGPHEIGDNVYLCPEPMLHLFGIKYPYGIVISDTFLKTPIFDYVDKSSIVDGWSDSSFGVTLYEYILNILSNQASSQEAQIYHSLLSNSNLLNNILASPVGFITKIEGMKNLPYIGSGSTGLPAILRNNLSDKICKNLMGPCAYKGLADYESTGIDLIGAQIFAALELGANLLASTITQSSGGTLSDLTGDINYGPYKILDKMLDLKELHLPTIKIQIPGFKYSSSFIGVQGAQGAIGPKGETGSQGVAGSQGAQGPIGLTGPEGEIGPQGAQGEAGPQGLTGIAGPSGLAGSVGLPGLPGAFNAGRSFLEELSKGSEMISGGTVENYSSFQLNETNSIVLSINNPSLANQVGVKVVISVNVDIIGSQGGLLIKSDHIDSSGNATELISKSLDNNSNSNQTYISNATIPILGGGEIVTYSEYTGTEVSLLDAFGNHKRISVDIVPIYLT